MLPKICCAEGMTSYLFERKIKIFDYPNFAQPFRDELRQNAEPSGRRKRDGDHVFAQAECAQGRPGEGNPGQTRESSGSGVHLLGHGTLCDLQGVAINRPISKLGEQEHSLRRVILFQLSLLCSEARLRSGPDLGRSQSRRSLDYYDSLYPTFRRSAQPGS